MDLSRLSNPDAYKQALAGLLRRGGEVTDYIATAPEKAGQAILQGHERNKALQAQAFANPNRPFQVTNQQAMGELGDRMLAGPLSVAPVGMIAYHGSPHTFEKFDISKIGTGVGQQLEGRGMYFSKNKELAETYKPNFDEVELQKELFFAKGDVNKALERVQREAQELVEKNAPQSTINETMNLWKSLEKMQMGENPVKGSLYKVDIPDEMLPKMIDFNKKITEQPEFIQNVLSDAMPSKYQNVGNFLQKAYANSKLAGKIVGKDNATADELSNFLQSNGISGIKYSEEISRIGQPAENFIVFEPSTVKILERNNQPISRKELLQQQIDKIE
jgi:hypothetical protein